MRGASLALLIAVSGLNSAPAMGQTTGARIEALEPFITEAARRFPVSETWIRAVIAAESGGRTELDGQPITSPAGAVGPMQVMPETYAQLRLRYGLGPDPADPEQNILAGTAYLGELYRRFGRAGMFAAYNAGPDRYQQFLDTGRPLPAETQAYLTALGLAAASPSRAPSFESGESLFFPLNHGAASLPREETEPTGGAMFAPLTAPESRFHSAKKAD